MATDTRRRFRRLRARNPAITATEMRQRLGISRQRVHEIARSEGIAFAAPTRASPKLCAVCGKPLTYPNTTTHAACHYVTLKCAECGKQFRRGRYDAERSKRHFCSRQCFVRNGVRR